MTAQIEALDTLIAAVRDGTFAAGDVVTVDECCVLISALKVPAMPADPWEYVSMALGNGLDALGAAVALFNALLPGWWWGMDSDSCATVGHHDTVGLPDSAHTVRNTTPARALLLATLAAYRSTLHQFPAR